MNIEQAKQVAIVEILDKLGHQPTRKGTYEHAYLSPLRHEKTASFFVNPQKNLWHDKGIDVGGNVITFAVKYLESQGKPHTVSDALRFISDLVGHISFIKPVETFMPEPTEHETNLVLKGVYPLKHYSLVTYLEERGIPLSLARVYLKQLYIHNKASGKDLFAIGMPNENESFEYRNKFMKGSLGPKDITFIRGKNPNRENLHLFEGFMDFLSVLAHRKITKLDDDVVILNSISMLKHVTLYLKDYGYKVIFTWLDNDDAGKKATQNVAEFCQAELSLTHIPQNKEYSKSKDVNEWYMKKLGLSE